MTTEAGRRLQADWDYYTAKTMPERIAAIEAEATRIDPDRLARALHAVPPMCVAGRVLSNKAPHSETDRMLAAAIARAYESEP